MSDDEMYRNTAFLQWANKHPGQYGDGLTSFERRLAWNAWQAGQEKMRQSIRDSGDRPPR